MKKEAFKTSFINRWKLYMLGILASFLVACISISIAASPTKKEKITVFITCNSVDDSFYDYFESLKPEYIEKMELYCKNTSDDYYGTFAEVYAKYADIIILPESKLSYVIKDRYIVLSNDIVDDFISNSHEYYCLQDIPYGLKIYSKDTHEGILNGYVNFFNEENQEDYYLFINASSYHMGIYNNSKYDGAINILKELLTNEKK